MYNLLHRYMILNKPERDTPFKIVCIEIDTLFNTQCPENHTIFNGMPRDKTKLQVSEGFFLSLTL